MLSITTHICMSLYTCVMDPLNAIHAEGCTAMALPSCPNRAIAESWIVKSLFLFVGRVFTRFVNKRWGVCTYVVSVLSTWDISFGVCFFLATCCSECMMNTRHVSVRIMQARPPKRFWFLNIRIIFLNFHLKTNTRELFLCLRVWFSYMFWEKWKNYKKYF